MKKLFLVFAVLAAQIVSAGEFSPVATIYQNAQGEQVILSTQDDVRVCVEDCIASFDRPSAELKQCIARCKR